VGTHQLLKTRFYHFIPEYAGARTSGRSTNQRTRQDEQQRKYILYKCTQCHMEKQVLKEKKKAPDGKYCDVRK
jgi:hypothetical protein